jgi:hypothetical protein
VSIRAAVVVVLALGLAARAAGAPPDGGAAVDAHPALTPATADAGAATTAPSTVPPAAAAAMAATPKRRWWVAVGIAAALGVTFAVVVTAATLGGPRDLFFSGNVPPGLERLP